MPVSTCSAGSFSAPDTYSLISQSSSTMTIGDSLPIQLVRKSARKGFTFNIMSVGPSDMNKTAILSALFGKNLDLTRDVTASNQNEMMRQRSNSEKDLLNPPVSVVTKSFEIVEKQVRLMLTIAESESYGEALCLKGTHIPLVEYIDMQFADYHRREMGHDRRKIRDKMIHCLFFFISPYGHGLSALDLEFLKSVHDRVNIIPIIGSAETLTLPERASFKRRIRDDLKRNDIHIYQMSPCELEDPDEVKRMTKDIQDAMPFAVSSMSLKSDSTVVDRDLEWGSIDPFNLDHSDFSLLKTMLHLQIPDLCEITLETFYEEYRLRMMNTDLQKMTCKSPARPRTTPTKKC